MLLIGLILGTLWLAGGLLSPLFRELGLRFNEAFRPDHDAMQAWTTLNGLCFEEVRVRAVVANEVIFRHKLGIDCLPIALLTEEARMQLAVVPVPLSIPVRGR